MKITTFDEDLLGLKSFGENLTNFLKVEHRYVDDALVISLNAPFGAGKSTFLRMWVDSFSKEETSEEQPLVLEINAWQDDYYNNPFVSLVTALCNKLQDEDKATKRLRTAATKAAWFMGGLGSQVAKKIVGIDPIELGELVEQKTSQGARKRKNQDDPFSVAFTKQEALQELRETIQTYVSAEKPNLWILIDELDRCRPDYAISYLETIKHVFNIHGIVFVLAVDRDQLDCSARAAFGADLDFSEYYRKFVQREISLPVPKEQSYRTLASKYVDYYLRGKGQRYCLLRLDRGDIETVVDLLAVMKMTPRQAQEVFRIIGHTCSTNETKQGKIFWCLGIGTILMSALKVMDPETFVRLGTAGLTIEEVVRYFTQLGLENVQWWFTLCYTGDGLAENEVTKRSPSEVFHAAGFLGDSETGADGIDLRQWSSGWGHGTQGSFRRIYTTIEQVTSWT